MKKLLSTALILVTMAGSSAPVFAFEQKQKEGGNVNAKFFDHRECAYYRFVSSDIFEKELDDELERCEKMPMPKALNFVKEAACYGIVIKNQIARSKNNGYGVIKRFSCKETIGCKYSNTPTEMCPQTFLTTSFYHSCHGEPVRKGCTYLYV